MYVKVSYCLILNWKSVGIAFDINRPIQSLKYEHLALHQLLSELIAVNNDRELINPDTFLPFISNERLGSALIIFCLEKV